MYQLFVQAIALTAILFYVLSFHAKTRLQILLIQLTGTLTWTVHFALLLAWTGMTLTAINGTILICLLFREKPWVNNRLFLPAGLLALGAGTLLSWEGFHSLLGFGGTAIMTFARWQKNPQKLRSISIFCNICFMIYDFVVGSWGGIISEITIMLSAIVAWWRGRKTFFQ